MDKSREQFGFLKEGKIGIRLYKGIKSHNWLVDNIGNQGVLKKKSINGVVVKPSLRVSIPIQRFKDGMQNQLLKMPDPNRAPARRPPPPPPIQRTPSPVTVTTVLRMVRHPVPTGKSRTKMTDKLEQIIKNPQPIYTNTINKNIPTTTSPLNLQVISDKGPEEKCTGKLNTAKNKTATKPHAPCQRATSPDASISIKHRLPVSLAPTKASNRSRLSNPDIIKNKLKYSNNIEVPLKLQETTQTDKVFIVSEEEVRILQMIKSKNITEDDYQILELIKNSAATKAEIETQFDILKRQNENVVIDLESISGKISENSEVMEKCYKHSDNNKSYLLAAIEVVKNLQNIEIPLPLTATVPEEHVTATVEQAPAPTINAACHSRAPAPSPKNTRNKGDMLKSLNVLTILQRFGQRINRENLEGTHTTDSNNQTTQTEDENNNKKREKSVEVHPVEIVVEPNSFHQVPLITSQSQNLLQTVQMPQQTNLVMVQQPHVQPAQLQLSQLQSLLMPSQFQPPQLQTSQLQPPQMWASQPQASHTRIQAQQLQSPQMQPPSFQPAQARPPQLQQSQLQAAIQQLTRVPPPQLLPAQTQPVTNEQFERPVQYFTPRRNRMTKMTQKRTYEMRNQDQFPFNQNRASTTTQEPALMPPQAPVQLSLNDPRRHSLHNQMTLTGHSPHLSCVLSTREANQVFQGSQTVSHPDFNCSYPGFYNNQDDFWPSGQQ